MAENTNNSDEKKFSITRTQSRPEDECESAAILIQEGLIDEAKRTLFRVLTSLPHHSMALSLLKKIDAIEMSQLLSPVVPGKKNTTITVLPEDIDSIIEKLDQDLDLGIRHESEALEEQEVWTAPDETTLDVAIAFYEMGCYADALREFRRVERKIRINESFLGEVGITAVALAAQCLVFLGRAHDARLYLEPVLLEPDLKHDDKLMLYYAIGLAEQTLAEEANADPVIALGWYRKASDIDPSYKDLAIRIQRFSNPRTPQS